MLINEKNRDVPGGPVVKNLPCNAEDTGLIPGWGAKILHAAEHQGPCITTTEPTPQAESPRATTTEAHVHQSPHAKSTEPNMPQLESLCTASKKIPRDTTKSSHIATKTPHSQINF